MRELNRKWKDNNKDRLKVHRDNRTRKLQTLVYSNYGNKCVCCGETNHMFLTMDHIHGDGSQKRKTVEPRGALFYAWIVKNSFPDYLRILCYNCNCGRYRNGGMCPHGDIQEKSLKANPRQG